MAYETLFCETENSYCAPAFHAGDAELASQPTTRKGTSDVLRNPVLRERVRVHHALFHGG